MSAYEGGGGYNIKQPHNSYNFVILLLFTVRDSNANGVPQDYDFTKSKYYGIITSLFKQ